MEFRTARPLCSVRQRQRIDQHGPPVCKDFEGLRQPMLPAHSNADLRFSKHQNFPGQRSVKDDPDLQEPGIEVLLLAALEPDRSPDDDRPYVSQVPGDVSKEAIRLTTFVDAVRLEPDAIRHDYLRGILKRYTVCVDDHYAVVIQLDSTQNGCHGP